jgi:hypothetical protein
MLRFLAALAALPLAGCVKVTMAWADLSPAGPAARPPALGEPPVGDPVAWSARRAEIREALQREVYGFFPDVSSSELLDRRVIDAEAFGGRAVLEEYRLGGAVRFGEVETQLKNSAPGGGFVMNVATPKGEGPFPVIMMETFCPRHSTLPHKGVAGAPKEERKAGMGDKAATYVFGRYICTPPVEMILDAGYAIASVFPGEIVPDDGEEGLAELRRLAAGHADEATRWGAIAAWASLYSRMIDALEQDPRLDQAAMIAWGHSRYGKAALVAAAFDDRIDGVIAHQSGTGGASLNRQKKGESVAAIMKSYPHWFAPAYGAFAEDEDAPGVDQHFVLAMIAPKPVLLGAARRDVWSDPNGAFRAAMAADPVYELLGSRGLEARRLDDFRPGDDIASWIRPGTHGVVEEDWPAFLAFLDAHFGVSARRP